jgi:polysaccharide export outer membrane protein
MPPIPTLKATLSASPASRLVSGRLLRTRSSLAFSALAATLLLGVTGCHTAPYAYTVKDPAPYREVRLREGDSVKISFPSSPNLDSTQIVRRDGNVTVTLGGEAMAMGKTPAELEKDILDRFGGQLAVKQVVVSLASSVFPVFVTGAVLRPGKISADRPLSALEAVMEAGGFDYAKANLKAVTVLRQQEGGQVVNYKLNFKDTLRGPKSEPFYLKPSDIIYVPEKFSWF